MSALSDNDELTEDVERLKLAVKVIDGKRKWFEDNEEYDEDDIPECSNKTQTINDHYHHFNNSNMYEENETNQIDHRKLISPLEGDNRECKPIERCLILNLHYQEWIKKNLNKVMLMLNHNRDCQKKLKAKEKEDIKNEKLQEIFKKKINSFRPYFKDSDGSFPNPNRDTIDRAKHGIVDAYIKQEKLWSSSEKETLKIAVKREILTIHTNYLIQKIDVENSKLNNMKKNSSCEKAILKTINKLKEEIDIYKNSNDDQIIYGNMSEIESIDWIKISNKDMRNDRSAENCRLFWKNAAHPLINNSRWTREEEVKLLNIVQKTGVHDWSNIAELLGTKRSAFMCIQRYQTKLNPCLHTGKWLKAEDHLLDEFVSMYQKNNFIPWTIVSKYIDGRSEEQCIRRWKQLHPKTYVRGKWSIVEDEKLKKAVEMFGTNWLMVQNYVLGRNSAQCRERFLNTLDKNIKFGDWSYEEDRTLWITVKTIGEGHWSYLSKILHHRTDNMILQRYRRLYHKATKSTSDTYNYLEQPVSLAELKNNNNLSEEELIKNDLEKGICVPRIHVKHKRMDSNVKYVTKETASFKTKLDFILYELEKSSSVKLSDDFINQLYGFNDMNELIDFLENVLSQLKYFKDQTKSENNDYVNLEFSNLPNDTINRATTNKNCNINNLEESKINKCLFLEWQILMEINKNRYGNFEKESANLEEGMIDENGKKTLNMISGALKINKHSTNRPKSASINLKIANSFQLNPRTSIVYDNIQKEITQKLVGRKAIGVYSVLPLPPNTSSMSAFKFFLENQYMLSASAGEFSFSDVSFFENSDDESNNWPFFAKYENDGVKEYLEDMHDYHLLKSRFLSLFLWPSILASLQITEISKADKLDNILHSASNNNQNDLSCLTLDISTSDLNHNNFREILFLNEKESKNINGSNPVISINNGNGEKFILDFQHIFGPKNGFLEANSDISNLEIHELLKINEENNIEYIEDVINNDINSDLCLNKKFNKNHATELNVSNSQKNNENVHDLNIQKNNDDQISLGNNFSHDDVTIEELEMNDSIIDTNDKHDLISYKKDVLVSQQETKNVSHDLGLEIYHEQNKFRKGQMITNEKCINGVDSDTNSPDICDQILNALVQNTDNISYRNNDLISVICTLLDKIQRIENNKESSYQLKTYNSKKRKRNSSDSSITDELNFERKSKRLQCMENKFTNFYNQQFSEDSSNEDANDCDSYNPEDNDYLSEDVDDTDDDDEIQYSLNVLPKRRKRKLSNIKIKKEDTTKSPEIKKRGRPRKIQL